MQLKKMIENLVYDQTTDKVAIRGWCFDAAGSDYEVVAKINGQVWAPAKITYEDREDIEGLYHDAFEAPHVGFRIELPLQGTAFHSVEVWIKTEEESTCILKKHRFQMGRWTVRNPLIYYLDSKKAERGILYLRGWCATTNTDTIPKITLTDAKGNPVEIDYYPIERKDVVYARGISMAHSECGFLIRTPYDETKDYVLHFEADGNTAKIPVRRSSIKLDHFLEKSGYRKVEEYYLRYGKKELIRKIIIKLFHLEEAQYNRWYLKTRSTEAQLEAQRKKKFDFEPKISFVVPLYQTPERYLKEMIESVQAQTYTNWELCLADGSGKDHSVESVVAPYMQKDSRIRYRLLEKNLGISGNTNAALEMAQGDYIALVDHDDLLSPDAAYYVVKALNDDRDVDVVYSDEDKVDMKSQKHFQPNFKPDFNIDMLRSVNYICHLFVVEKGLLERAGHFREEFNGAQDYDFILRCTEQSKKIYHVQRVLYHWRCHPESTAMDPSSKMYAFEAGLRAVNEHYKRVGIPAHVEHGLKYGMYHTIYEWKEKPLVSVLIPNKDHTEDLDVVIRSLARCTYKNYEVIVIENNSTEAETWEYYDKIQKEFSNVHVVKWEKEFNYSAINNFGAEFAKGEYLLLLNNDVEVITTDCFEEMLGYAQRPDVGIVGIKLLYNDDTVQHAGVVIGLGGVAGHAFPGVRKEDAGYMGRAVFAQDYCAVTAACLMVRKSVFDEVGGLDTGLQVAFNDIDFCLRVYEKGYKIVYNPYAQMYHYESKSRGYEDTPEKQARFAREIEFFQNRWGEFLAKGDPFYSPNLTLDKNDFSLRKLREEEQ